MASLLRTQLTALSLILLTACGGSSDSGPDEELIPTPEFTGRVSIAGEKNNTLYLYTANDIWTLKSGVNKITHKLSSRQLKDEGTYDYQGFSYAKLIDEHLFVQRNYREYDLDLWLINEDTPLQSKYVLRSGDTHDQDYRIRPFAKINDRFIFIKSYSETYFHPSLSSS